MAMSACRNLLAGAVAVMSIAACTRAPYLVVFNRTGVPLTIERTPPYESDVTIAPGSTHRARFPDAMRLTVTAGTATWRYAVSFPPRELARWSRLGRPEFQVQVEPDGRVYVLAPDATPPVQELPAQPEGFPLVPLD
jgi:hypothetical protein